MMNIVVVNKSMEKSISPEMIRHFNLFAIVDNDVVVIKKNRHGITGIIPLSNLKNVIDIHLNKYLTLIDTHGTKKKIGEQSQFYIDTKAMKDKACSACHGLGECDDCSEFDISYNTWICRRCEGSGYEPTECKINDVAGV